jgi:hypothetical protein
MREGKYQAQLVTKLKGLFPGCVIQRNDPRDIQGIPDLTIFWGPCYALLEVKESASAPEQPNQRYYVEQFADMSFAAFIYPENEEEVLDALQHAFSTGRATCVLKP